MNDVIANPEAAEAVAKSVSYGTAWIMTICALVGGFVIAKLTSGNNKAEVDKLKKEKSSLTVQLGDQKDLSAQTLKDAKEAMAQRDKATARMDELQNQLNGKQAEVEKAAQEYSAANAALKQRAEKAEGALKSANERNSSAGRDLASAQEDAKNAKAALNTANKELTAVRSDLKKSLAASENSAAALADAKQKLKDADDPKIVSDALKYRAIRTEATPSQLNAIAKKVKREDYGFVIPKKK